MTGQRFEGTRRVTDVMLSYRRNHRPRGQQWSVSLPKIFLGIALCYSIIVVLTVEIGMGRPSNYLGHDALFGQTIRRPASEWTGRNCTYKGNCPALSFCGASGRCMPYLARKQVEAMPEVRLNGTALGPSAMTNVSTCVQQCIQDAVWDERYYFLSVANVIGAMEHSASGADAPKGCVVICRRSSSREAQPTTDEWQQNRAYLFDRDIQNLLDTRDVWQDGQAGVSWLRGTHIANWVGCPKNQIAIREEQEKNSTAMMKLAADRLLKEVKWFGFLEDSDRSMEMLRHEYRMKQTPKMSHANANAKNKK